MNCLYCNTEVPSVREICPNNDCYKPIKPIPVPPGGRIRFGKYLNREFYNSFSAGDRARLLGDYE